MNKKILVTGAAGYIGTVFLRYVCQESWVGEIIGLDKVKPTKPIKGVTYRQCDITTTQWTEIIVSEKPDILVHLAFIVNPIRDVSLMRTINVLGTRRTFEAAKQGGVSHILVASSATAYGAWPDNPIPLTEEHPIRPHPTFQYGREKGELESYYQQFAEDNDTIGVAVIRPVIVYGPGVDNYLSRFIFAFPIVPLVERGQTPLQLVHEDDVARIMVRIVALQKQGVFNIGAEDYLTLAEICRLADRKTMPLPKFLLNLMMKMMWQFNMPAMETPETILDYIIYPWVVSVEKVKKELNFSFQYSSQEALQAMLAARNKS
ncbi:NAD-dependent epimerase/dehydratase family protein [candidate division CSSED10-310 bacterium]|uniref:NAD-dependent epimerase/dehydratase family protein n=1 Tax=candidate division CSSED10-310 bacterium TaxID=2855610 RepID=A0ABV6Z3Q3_UNCC1